MEAQRPVHDARQLRDQIEGQRLALSDTQELLREDPTDVEVQDMVAELEASVEELELLLKGAEDQDRVTIDVGQQYRFAYCLILVYVNQCPPQ
jgi:hypothetical protein